MSRDIQRLGVVGLVILGATVPATGEPVSVRNAENVAVNQLNSTGQAVLDADAVLGITRELEGDLDIYYTINFEPEGWAIIAADDVAYPVIAYSATGRQAYENASPSFLGWMANVKAEIAHAIQQDSQPLPEASVAWATLAVAPDEYLIRMEGREPDSGVEPLIQSTWGQGKMLDVWPWTHDDYNTQCPWEYTSFTHGTRCYAYTGCVATAMAQIMRYWQWPPCTDGSIPGYDPPHDCDHECSSRYDWMEVQCDDNCFYNWEDMPLGSDSDEIARLMMHIGVGVQMDYDCGGSTAGTCSDAPDAYAAYFRYIAPGDCTERADHPTNWGDLLRSELDAGRPVHYRGDDGGPVGHSFICDGYQTSGSDHFHFNWGWDGDHDGYYYLNDLTPSSYDFTIDQMALLGLRPDYPDEMWVDESYTPHSCGGHDCGYNAFSDLQTAIDWASGPTLIHVGDGTYGPLTILKPDITIAGEGPTTVLLTAVGLDDEGLPITVPAVRLIGAGNVRLENLAIWVVPLSPLSGAVGLECLGGAVTLDNCEIRREAGGPPVETIGLRSTAAHVTLTDCSFVQPLGPVAVPGGGLVSFGSQIQAEDCSFVGLQSSGNGAALWTQAGNVRLVSCLFAGNSGLRGGAVANTGTEQEFHNCLFTGNSAEDRGGAVYSWSAPEGQPTFVNCTLSGNTAFEGGGIRADDGVPTMANCILWGNTAPFGPQIGGAATVTYSCIEGGWAGEGNVAVDPLFVDADGPDDQFGTLDDDLHLLDGSPCINAGDDSAVPDDVATDFEGDDRFQQCRVDMGMDETPFFNGPDCNSNGVEDACDLATTPTVTIEILTDDYGHETTWELVEQGGDVVASGGPYGDDTLYTIVVDLEPGTYHDFTIYDSFGDGICCSYGEGYYRVFAGEELVCSGGDFAYQETCPGIGSGAADCNTNGVPDECDIFDGTSQDCNENAIPDECDVTSEDCNTNGVLDECDIGEGFSQDCNVNGVPDECDVTAGTSQDCNTNGVPDECDIAHFTWNVSENTTGVPDEVFAGPPDDDFAGIGGQIVTYDLGTGLALDTAGPDFNVYEVDYGGVEFHNIEDVSVSEDGADFYSVVGTEGPIVRITGDEMHGNDAFARSYDISAAGLSVVRYIRIDGLDDGPGGGTTGFDLDAIGIINVAGDCNANAVPDECDIAVGTSLDCNANQVPDECDLLDGGDFHADGDVDLGDFEVFYSVMSGPYTAITPPDPACIDAYREAFDFDFDGDVDLIDFTELQVSFDGGV